MDIIFVSFSNVDSAKTIDPKQLVLFDVDQLKNTDQLKQPGNNSTTNTNGKKDQEEEMVDVEAILNSLPISEKVYLSVRVPECLRRWWIGQCKLRGITMQEVITEALLKKFGSPPN